MDSGIRHRVGKIAQTMIFLGAWDIFKVEFIVIVWKKGPVLSSMEYNKQIHKYKVMLNLVYRFFKTPEFKI